MPRHSDEMKEMWLPENPNLGCLGSNVAQVSSVRPSTFHHYQCHSNAFMLCTKLRKQKVLRKFRINIFDSEDFHDFFLILFVCLSQDTNCPCDLPWLLILSELNQRSFARVVRQGELLTTQLSDVKLHRKNFAVSGNWYLERLACPN